MNFPQVQNTQPTPPCLSPTNNLVKLPSPPIQSDSTFDSSVNSSVRINSAIQKGRERMKQTDRRNSHFSSSMLLTHRGQ
uniref:Uncharacterized protein n=1 Tax=Ditylenchus dipsaci TaxID=166011 RepID=A0A915D3S5_9BILA